MVSTESEHGVSDVLRPLREWVPALGALKQFGTGLAQESDVRVDHQIVKGPRMTTGVCRVEQVRPLGKKDGAATDLLAGRGPSARDARVELNNRLAFPAACLVFALLGIGTVRMAGRLRR